MTAKVNNLPTSSLVRPPFLKTFTVIRGGWIAKRQLDFSCAFAFREERPIILTMVCMHVSSNDRVFPFPKSNFHIATLQVAS